MSSKSSRHTNRDLVQNRRKKHFPKVCVDVMVYKDVSQNSACETKLESARSEFEARSGSKCP